VGTEWLNESGSVGFLYFSEGDQRKFAAIGGCKDQSEVLDKVRNWGRSNNAATWFIQISSAKSNETSQNIDMLVAHCAERNQKEGFVLFQKLAVNPSSNKFEPVGQIDYMKRIPNDFF
jgi:hypothetical protein